MIPERADPDDSSGIRRLNHKVVADCELNMTSMRKNQVPRPNL